ncbi:MAG TPA: hypothetical protein VFE57_07865, partial [Cyclobacteriaceae bacterium]|nr:hypothetical protein [Cyclobacteriaceae bacterium]
FVSLYPIQNEIFPGVRLCIFEKDEEQAREVLKENNLHASSHDLVLCHHCHSANVVRNASQENGFYRVMAALLLTIFISPKTMYHCNDCDREFA